MDAGGCFSHWNACSCLHGMARVRTVIISADTCDAFMALAKGGGATWVITVNDGASITGNGDG